LGTGFGDFIPPFISDHPELFFVVADLGIEFAVEVINLLIAAIEVELGSSEFVL
jgi:hypothetical protein